MLPALCWPYTSPKMDPATKLTKERQSQISDGISDGISDRISDGISKILWLTCCLARPLPHRLLNLEKERQKEQQTAKGNGEKEEKRKKGKLGTENKEKKQRKESKRLIKCV